MRSVTCSFLLVPVFAIAPSLARAEPPRQDPIVQLDTFAAPTPVWLDVELWFHAVFPTWPSPGTIGVDKPSSACSSAISSRIDGEFEGWHGETVFKLANGQLWKQASNQLSHAYKHSPDVLVYWADGVCKLKVSGMVDEVFVERLE